MFQERSYFLRAYYTWPLNCKSILSIACCGFVALLSLKYLFNQSLSSTSRLLRVFFWGNVSTLFEETQLMPHALWYQINLWFCWILSSCFSSHTGKNLQPQYKGYYKWWYCTNDESFVSDSKVVGIENVGQKLEVR